jgi:hypothetical protein
MRRKRVDWRALVGTALVLAGMPAFPSASHDWYPMECCSGTDCAVVEHITYASSADAESDLPTLVVTTKHGTARVPPNFPRRPSKDGEMHACIRPVRDTMKLICLFVPPPS